MRKLTLAAALAVVAASLASFVSLPGSPVLPAASVGPISTYDLTLAASPMTVDVAPDAF